VTHHDGALPFIRPYWRVEIVHRTLRHYDQARHRVPTIGAGSFDLVSGLFAELATLIEQNGHKGHFGLFFLCSTYDATTKVGVGDDRGEEGA
jgi:hypothetical protein